MFRTPNTKLEQHLYDLKISIREIDAISKKLQRVACIERIKCKQCVKKGNDTKARWHAEIVVRNLTSSTNYMKICARVDGLIHYLENAIINKSMLNNMEEIARYMQEVLKVRDLKRASLLMDRFEREFERLDLKSAGIEEALETCNLPVATQEDINELMSEVTEEARMETKERMPSVDMSVLHEA